MGGALKAHMLLASVLVLFAATVRAATVSDVWKVEYAYKSPDCVEKLIIAINGQFPGPTIRATNGDTVSVTVHNDMPTESVVIHWHGILQKGTPWDDGAALVSQCPINPLETYTYSFQVDHPGTFFYHGHYGMQRNAGFYGSLIVVPNATDPEEPFTYDGGELSILLDDWWHKSMYDLELGLFSDPFRWVGEPQSLLIEGRGAYNCSKVPILPVGASSSSGDVVTCNATNDQCTPYILPVEPGKTYRLRIASVASLSSLNFLLEGHNMTVVEASGYYVEPVNVTNLDVYSGETYSVLFTTKADTDPGSKQNYWAALNVRGREPITPGRAVLNYAGVANTSLPTTAVPVGPAWNDSDLSLANARVYRALAGYNDSVPGSRTGPTTRLITLLNTQNTLKGLRKWAINNITYVPTPTPVLADLKFSAYSNGNNNELLPVPLDNYTAGYDIYSPPPYTNTTKGSGVYIFNIGDVVDVVLQNANTLVLNTSEYHPWHLHGHDFWVLGFGKGVFDPSTDYANLTFDYPPKVNTVPLFPYGWTIIRFVADNPGAWPFHCHIESHFHLGMGVIFAEGVNQLPEIPIETLGCGLSKLFIKPPT